MGVVAVNVNWEDYFNSHDAWRDHAIGIAAVLLSVLLALGLARKRRSGSAWRRRLLTFCSSVSLLLCLTVCVLWFRSYRSHEAAMDAWGGDRLPLRGETRPWELRSERGGVTLYKQDRYEFWIYTSSISSGSVSSWGWRGVGGFSYRLPFAVTASLPLAWLIGWKRSRRRVASDLCAGCGYDLRATSDRCPECGAVPDGRKVRTT